MSAKCFKRILFILLITVIFAGVSLPCGPFLPDRVLDEKDSYLLEPPEGIFYEEIRIIKNTLDSYLTENNSEYKKLLKYSAIINFKTERTDVSELKEALGNTNSAEIQSKIIDYEKIREKITNFQSEQNRWERKKLRQGSSFDENKTLSPGFDLSEIPKGLPGEFNEYLQGAIYYHLDQLDKAISVWEKLLKRPDKQRKYRSTWAAFMIGRALVDEHPDESIKWFELTRELYDKGFEDSLGLAAASIGWQARAELNRRNYVKAIELYMLQLASGDDSALSSLQTVCSKVLEDNMDLQNEAAKNILSRKIVTSYILSRGGPSREAPSPSLAKKWISAIDSAKINDFEEAGRFAWAAYSAGDFSAAGQWVLKASNDDIMANWIEAKLLLQQGKTIESIKLLVHIARIVSPNDEILEYNKYKYQDHRRYTAMPFLKTIRGEMGLLYLSQTNYVEALDSLIRGAYWEDAAYIAERLLTIEELKKYIDQTWPSTPQNTSNDGNYLPARLRLLLARRFARMDKWEQARPYFNRDLQKTMDIYTNSLLEGKNKGLSKEKRAAALWRAAVIAYRNGMELMGTELDGNWVVYNGSAYDRAGISDIRENMLTAEIAPSSTNEVERTQQTIPPENKFNYRYLATDLAWQAALLMPNNSDQTASVLCIAGSWIKAKDPQGADKFYKALVNRNRKTALGQEADKLRWFPTVTSDLYEKANGGSQ